MTSQSDVAVMLALGEDVGDIPPASNFRAVKAKDSDETYDAYILSYGWAVVFGRDKETGEIVEFTGWRGYSPSTSSQMGKARNAIERVMMKKPLTVSEKPVYSGANPLNWRVAREL